mgnify:FL=1
MKKHKWWLIPIIAVVVLAVLTVPFSVMPLNDGGTVEYRALTYTLVKWNRLQETGPNYQATRVYPLSLLTSIDDLWAREQSSQDGPPADSRTGDCTFRATVLEVKDNFLMVEPLTGEEERRSSDKITLTAPAGTAVELLQPGCPVEVQYDGMIAESYPAQINASSVTIADACRQVDYTGAWLSEADSSMMGTDGTDTADVRIVAIYKNCFFARYVVPMPTLLKINGVLDKGWCIGDQVQVSMTDARYQTETQRIEGTLRSVGESNFQLEEGKAYKPVIYLYPPQETEVSVRLALDGALTCTYPAYHDGWRVTARPDGTLTDAAGQEYSYLYWEGQLPAAYDFSRGFCVKGSDAAAFLDSALAQLGLNRREANEFIVYWLPQLEQNPYNLIAFQTAAYTDAARLQIDPAPDTLIRVFMAYRPLPSPQTVPPQALTAPRREGFTVVEWGGALVR